MNTPKIARILVVDDHPLPLEITCALLASVFEGAEISKATGLDEAMGHVQRSGAPDLAVLDLGLPDCAGIEALKRLRAAYPRTAVVVYSAAEDGVTVRAALRAGAKGYIPKNSSKELMRAALRLVAEGGTYVPPEALAGAETPAPGLTGREHDVLRLLLRGYSNRKIAKVLGISETTVKHHAGAIFGALGVSSRAEAIVVARQRGIHPD